MDLSEAIDKIRQLGIEATPDEACGCLLSDGSGGLRLLQGRNVAVRRDLGFEVDRATMLRAMRSGEALKWIYHTHLKEAHASERDVRACNRLGIPFLIVGCDVGHALLYPNEVWAGLCGRPWVLGSADCVSLVEAYYERAHGIQMPKHGVPATWPPRRDHFAALAASWGFEAVEDDDLHRVGRPGDPLRPGITPASPWWNRTWAV